MAFLQDVFKDSGVPTYTFVEPNEYIKIVVTLSTKGRCLVVEGPSGIGKTTCVLKALEYLGMGDSIQLLTPRKKKDILSIEKILDNNENIGTVIIDDFHLLSIENKNRLSDLMKTIADEDREDVKLVLIGINRAGDSLVSLAPDLNNRITTVKFEVNPDSKILELIEKGEVALNARIKYREQIVRRSNGSFHIAQLICKELCIIERVIMTQDNKKELNTDINYVVDKIMTDLSRVFEVKAREFAIGSRLRSSGRAPYFHLLYWLSESKDWTIRMADIYLKYPTHKASISQVADKGFLYKLINNSENIKSVIHYDEYSKVLTVEEANSVFRDSKETVVNFIVTELQEAIRDLPVTRPNEDYGRITKGGALGILGRVFLAEKRWEEAKDTYKQIMNLGVYEIDPRFSDLFIEKGENSKEFLLVSKRTQDLYTNSIQLVCQGFTWGGWHHFSPYNELVEEFCCIDGLPIHESPLFDPEKPYENRDPRLLKTVFVDNVSVFKGILYIAHPDSNPSIYMDQLLRRPWSGYAVRKFCDESYEGNLNSYGCDFPMIRYAEVLLSYLEANIESGSPITQHLLDETINRVRGREEIKMPSVTETNPDKLTTILRRERRVELAWEGLRLFDLFRWRTAHIYLRTRFHGMKDCSAKDAPTYTTVPVDENGYYLIDETFFREDVDYLWPIPQTERDVNKNLTQNYGY